MSTLRSSISSDDAVSNPESAGRRLYVATRLLRVSVQIWAMRSANWTDRCDLSDQAPINFWLLYPQNSAGATLTLLTCDAAITRSAYWVNAVAESSGVGDRDRRPHALGPSSRAPTSPEPSDGVQP